MRGRVNSIWSIGQFMVPSIWKKLIPGMNRDWDGVFSPFLMKTIDDFPLVQNA